MKIAAVQFSPEPGNIAGNLAKMEEYVRKASKKGVSIIVFPEIADIGYDLPQIKKLATALPCRATAVLSAAARKYKVAIVAGIARKDGKRLLNSAVLFDAKGRMMGCYDKTHLCPIPPINEPAVFSRGKKIGVYKLGKITVGMAICYDIRFPEVFRKMSLLGANMIFLPTAFPASRIDQLITTLKARAIENQIFMVSANNTGEIADIKFGGHSMIVGPDGDVRAVAGISEEMIIADIDIKDVDLSRKKRPIFSERRPELYR